MSKKFPLTDWNVPFNWKPIGNWKRVKGNLVRKKNIEVQQQEDREVPKPIRTGHKPTTETET